jgi:hypothetical protein
MIEVLMHHPRLYSYATGAAKLDPMVLNVAHDGSLELAKRFLLDLHINGHDDSIDLYIARLRSHLATFDTFSRYILGNMLSSQSIKETGTNLTLLNQGLETSLVFKKKIAAYAGIPVGQLLSILRNAEKHVCEAIAPWTPSNP